MKRKIFILGLLVFVLASCASPTKVVPTKTTIPLPTSTSASPAVEATPVRATPTEFQLPFNDKNVESKYCQLPSVKLSIPDAQGLSDDEIAEKLMDLFLAYFDVPQAPDWCRIGGHKIDKIYYDERTPSLPLEPKGNIMRVVQYSIKLIQIPNFWMSLVNEVDQQNWAKIYANVAIFRSADAYTMKFAYP